MESQAFPVKYLELLHTSLVWAFDDKVGNIYEQSRYGPYPIAAWWLKRGTVTLNFGGEEERYHEGHWIFPRFAEGTQQFSDDARILSIRFYAEWADGRTLFDRARSVAFPVADAPELTRAATRLLRAGAHQEGKALMLSVGQFLRVRPLFNQWIAAYYDVMTRLGIAEAANRVYSDVIWQILFYMKHRPLQTPLYDSELARIAGLSVSQLHRLFSREVGESPLSVWNRRRFETATFYLLGNQQSVKAIAFQLGFSSPEHFCKWFRQRTGMPPRAYRHAVATEAEC